MTDEQVRTRAYFHYINQTGCPWYDPVSNWLQAEQEERAHAVDAPAEREMPSATKGVVRPKQSLIPRAVSANELPHHLMHTFASAELTTCLLLRPGLKDTDPESLVNAFSVLLFNTKSAEKMDCPSVFLTKKEKPKDLPGGRYSFLAKHSILGIDEAVDLATFDASFYDPRHTQKRVISAPGKWLPTTFVGQDEHPLRKCLPRVPHSFWVREHWHSADKLATKLGEVGISWIQDKLMELLKIRIQRHQLGSFMAVFPEERVRMHVNRSHDGSRLGIEVQNRGIKEHKLMLLARGSRNGKLVTTALHPIERRFTVVPFAPEIDQQDVELYDADTGIILDRDAGTPNRTFSMTMIINPTDVNVPVNLDNADGSSRPTQYRAKWGLIQESAIGAPADWETADRLASIKAEQEKLYRRGHLFIYVGSEEDRRRAVDDIRKLIRTHAKGRLDIWDPYFGAEDAIEFLPNVVDQALPIRILTSIKPTIDEKREMQDARKEENGDGTAVSSPRDLKKKNLQKVLSTLRRPGESSGLKNLHCKLGGANFHDRFIITENMCWQLGCSFNQIGRVTSTIVVLPCPAVIQKAFDHAWKRRGDDL